MRQRRLEIFLFAWDSPLYFLPRGFRAAFFVRAGTAQLIHHSVVAFVAGVFEILVSRLLTDGNANVNGAV